MHYFKPSTKVDKVIANVKQQTKYCSQEDFVSSHAGSNDLTLNVKEKVLNLNQAILQLKQLFLEPMKS